MSKLETIVGRITHTGRIKNDEHVHQYSLIEVTTAEGRVDLPEASAANALSRAVQQGRSVALAVLRIDEGGKEKCTILAVYDPGERRLFTNEEIYKLRDHILGQAFLYSFLGIVFIPVGLAFFVVPGLLYIRVLWKLWTSIGKFPKEAEIRAAVEGLQQAVA